MVKMFLQSNGHQSYVNVWVVMIHPITKSRFEQSRRVILEIDSKKYVRQSFSFDTFNYVFSCHCIGVVVRLVISNKKKPFRPV